MNSKKKPSIPKGTRDFDSKVVKKRNYIINIIRSTFNKFGFLALETPTMENLSVLTGKYGDEGDQLIFKILNSGDYASKIKTNIGAISSKILTPQISDKGLRYDLTVPLARYVAMNQSKITFPFRRYQMQSVWRADRPQKGRYREFMQCDADIVGTNSFICEAEMMMMMNEILQNLNIEGYQIVINNRKILSGLAEYLGHKDKIAALCVAIDKIDKIGKSGVFKELKKIGYKETQLNNLLPILELVGSNQQKIQKLKSTTPDNEKIIEGLTEISQILNYVKLMSGNLTTVNFNPSLARGLSYYTASIFEIKILDGSIGSISGGGRYDNLTNVFGLPNVSGVGFSLGIDRIYDVMEARNLFPKKITTTTQVLITNFGVKEEIFAIKNLIKLRKKGIASELYPTAAKLKKQMIYANNLNIPFVVLIGSNEVENNKITVKNMTKGTQELITINELIDKLKK